MATLTRDQLQTIRTAYPSGPWTKDQINAAVQAIETTFEGAGRTAINSAIEAAAPGVFTAGQKRAVVKQYLILKFNLGG